MTVKSVDLDSIVAFDGRLYRVLSVYINNDPVCHCQQLDDSRSFLTSAICRVRPVLSQPHRTTHVDCEWRCTACQELQPPSCCFYPPGVTGRHCLACAQDLEERE